MKINSITPQDDKKKILQFNNHISTPGYKNQNKKKHYMENSIGSMNTGNSLALSEEKVVKSSQNVSAINDNKTLVFLNNVFEEQITNNTKDDDKAYQNFPNISPFPNFNICSFNKTQEDSKNFNNMILNINNIKEQDCLYQIAENEEKNSLDSNELNVFGINKKMNKKSPFDDIEIDIEIMKNDINCKERFMGKEVWGNFGTI